MPSPSKIPRFRSAAAGKRADVPEPTAVNKEKTQKERVKTRSERRLVKPEIKVQTFVPEKLKKSPNRALRVVKSSQKENQMPKTALHDRRGISEIKKSESNLRTRVESLEHDINSMKHELNATKHEVQNKEKQMKDARQNELDLRREFEELKSKNAVQARALEKLNVDPVTGTLVRHTDLFNTLLTSCEDEQQTFASDLRSCMADISCSISGIQERLDLLPNFEGVEIVSQ